jgi:NAD(P)-dependent dehydrogenase (short-subunit alcohol dehydrogenase family)
MAADLEGKTILVTGAGSGIGKATATLAAAAGASVVALDIKGHDETASSITESGGTAEAHTLDVTDAGAWEKVVRDVLERHGKIDGLANVAGIVTDVDNLLDQTEDGWDRILAIDLKGPFLGMKSVLPSMLDTGGGKIVNVASTAGLIGMPNVVAYSAAKGGVIAMSRQVAIEYAARNIRVNIIAPGVTKTSMLGDITEDLLNMVTAATPAGRLGAPEDPGAMIVYLLGPGSDFITGQVIAVDGGWTAQ